MKPTTEKERGEKDDIERVSMGEEGGREEQRERERGQRKREGEDRKKRYRR